MNNRPDRPDRNSAHQEAAAHQAAAARKGNAARSGGAARKGDGARKGNAAHSGDAAHQRIDARKGIDACKGIDAQSGSEGKDAHDGNDLVARILAFQACFAERIDPGPALGDDDVRARWREGRPLFEEDPPGLTPALQDEAVRGARDALPEGAPEPLVRRIALAPFFARAAAPYRERIADSGWRRGVCPICGAEPALGRLAPGEGRRTLYCALCRVEWRFARLACPFCDAPPQRRHFTLDGDDARRVECCEACRRYLKTLDERVLGRAADLAREDLNTGRLDAAALDAGYA